MENLDPNMPEEINGNPSNNIPVSPIIPTPSSDLSTGGEVAPKSDYPIGGRSETVNFDTAKPKIEPTPKPAPQPQTPPIIPTSEVKPPIDTMMVLPDISSKPSSKRLIAGILTGVFLIALIGVGVYFFAFAKKGAQTTISSNQPGINLVIDGVEYTNVTIPYKLTLDVGKHTITATKEGFSDMSKTLDVASKSKTYAIAFDLQTNPTPIQILKKEIFFPAYDKDTATLVFFEKKEGGYSLKEYNVESQTETILIQSIGEITKVAWSPSYRQLAIKVVNSEENQPPLSFISEYGQGTKVNWIVNLNRGDLVNISVKNLHPSIKNIAFNPTGTKIVYLFQNDVERVLSIANIDGTNYERLAEFKTIEFEPDVAWSASGSRVAIFANQELGVASRAQNPNVSVYDFTTRAITRVSFDGVSYGGIFSPDSSYLAYNSGNAIAFYNLDNKTEEYQSLKTDLTASIDNSAWIDNQTLVVLGSDRELYKLRIDGTQERINFNNSALAGSIKNVIQANGEIFLIGNSGVYKLGVGEGI